jgi:hypothetical protein
MQVVWKVPDTEMKLTTQSGPKGNLLFRSDHLLDGDPCVFSFNNDRLLNDVMVHDFDSIRSHDFPLL